jgi:hypothetical protein
LSCDTANRNLDIKGIEINATGNPPFVYKEKTQFILKDFAYYGFSWRCIVVIIVRSEESWLLRMLA